MRRSRWLIALFLVICAPNVALAWGASGHSIVAEIAQRRLEPGVLAKVKELLGGEVALASIASWADDVRPKERKTTNWHFVDIPYDAERYDPARDCQASEETGDCVINALKRLRQTLGDAAAAKEERARALKFIVHFVGDIHQPLHCAERNHDRGGNDVVVWFLKDRMALHAVWDYGVIDKHVFNWGEYVREIMEEWLPKQNIAELEKGEPVDWALESHDLAVAVVYNKLPGDLTLDDRYIRDMTPHITKQLGVAGLRLAKLLNDTLR
jgi:hypothetical protein